MPVRTPELLYHIHSLIVTNKLNETEKALEVVQQEIDMMRHLLQDSGVILYHQSAEEEEGLEKELRIIEKTSIWDFTDQRSIMSFTTEGSLIPTDRAWDNQFRWAVEKAMKIINSIDGTSYTLLRVLSSYFMWNDKGLSLILNLEVQEPSSKYGMSQDDENTKYYQVHLERPVYSVLEHVYDPSYYKVTIVVIVSELYAAELKLFIDSVTSVIKKSRSGPSLTLLVVRMGHKEQGPPSKIDAVLQDPATTGLDVQLVSSSQWLSRSHGLSLAVKHMKPTELALLADVDIRFDSEFLSRCSVYPDIRRRVYIPFPTIGHSPMVQNLVSQLPPDTSSSHNYWFPSTGIMCLYVADLISVVMETGKGIPEEISTKKAFNSFAKKGYQVLQGLDPGLEWKIGSRDCGLVLLGEPCESEGISREESKVGSTLVSHYLAQQMIQ